MIELLPGTWGPRLSFLSVAIWWAVFSIPIMTRVPEPPAATAQLGRGENVLTISFRRLWETLKDIRHYRQLFKYLIAFLIYNDGIGTIIGVAAIYGAELGFGSVELILALLLVQFVGIPFSLIFGRLPSPAEKRRPAYLAFIAFNFVALPLVGLVGARALPGEITGAPLPPYAATATTVGQGVYLASADALTLDGTWEMITVPAEEIGADQDEIHAINYEAGARYELAFNGQQVEITYSTGPDGGIWVVEMDGQPFLDRDTGLPLTLDGFNPTVRHGVRHTLTAPEPGEHVLAVVNSGDSHPESQGTAISLAQVEVLRPIRQSSLPLILGLIVAVEAAGILFALLLGRPLFSGLAARLDTRSSIILALTFYALIAIWGFFLDSVIEFWFLAWMVAVVQGGSQALSRSLYASMSPAAKSGEFFGLYGVMEKFSAVIGPLMFAAAAAVFDSSRPAVLSLILLFAVGILLLSRVDVEEGRRVASEEDRRAGLT
jgi:MFS-type transporter involved in bile tolerance (Atg22 family)